MKTKQRRTPKEQIWVYPEFKTILKKMAADKKKSMLELTKDLSGEKEMFPKITKNFGKIL